MGWGCEGKSAYSREKNVKPLRSGEGRKGEVHRRLCLVKEKGNVLKRSDA